MNAQADANLRWAYVSKGRFSDVATDLCFNILNGHRHC